MKLVAGAVVIALLVGCSSGTKVETPSSPAATASPVAAESPSPSPTLDPKAEDLFENKLKGTYSVAAAAIKGETAVWASVDPAAWNALSKADQELVKQYVATVVMKKVRRYPNSFAGIQKGAPLYDTAIENIINLGDRDWVIQDRKTNTLAKGK